jgi:dienelactone hydrolase
MAVATALASRLADAVRWISDQTPLAGLPLGLFGASTGAAAALVAAAALSDRVGAVVSRGGHPDLAGHALDKVRAPTLLIVGGDDAGIIVLNEKALAQLRSPKDLRIVSGASHLFPEPVRLLKVPKLRRLSVRGSCANRAGIFLKEACGSSVAGLRLPGKAPRFGSKTGEPPHVYLPPWAGLIWINAQHGIAWEVR